MIEKDEEEIYKEYDLQAGMAGIPNINYTLEDQLVLEELENRHIEIAGNIDADTASVIRYKILFYNKRDEGIEVKDRIPIIIYIKSNGGGVLDGFEIADSILTSKTPIITVNTGYCLSMAFIIFLCGHKRVSYPHATFLIHEGYTNVEDSSTKVKEYIDFFDGEVEKEIKDIILSRTKITNKLYNKQKKTEWYMLAKKAKELGIVDSIVGVDCDLESVI